MDNASTDGTWKEIWKLCPAHGAAAVRHPASRGYGGSVKTALSHCVEAGLEITESVIPTFYGEEKSNVPRLGTPC
ncbi:MAG TPA: hypothetical protein VLH09_04545 [Bryobacteraceae bacterium]|nr:hypothetical protein [Bryobacteraceae bacterium]